MTIGELAPRRERRARRGAGPDDRCPPVRPANQPVAIFARTPRPRARPRARAAPTRSPGSIWNEKKRKNTAANRSRSGPMSAPGPVLHRAGQREPDEEGADGGGHLELLGEPADERG